MNRTSMLIGALLAWAVTAEGQSSAPPRSAAAPVAQDLSGAQQLVFRRALELVRPCIVKIETIGGAQPVQSAQGDDGETRTAGFRQADGPTTGVIWTADGGILTSSINFYRDPAVITVTLHDGRRFVATLVARDRYARLALLRIKADNLPTPRFVMPEALRPGQWALAAGWGHGADRPTLSVGIVSALERAAGMAIQTDVKVSPANYGGPLFDIEGRVAGVCVPMSPSDDDELAGVEWYDSGIGFAISVEHIARKLPRLLRGETLERGLLGIGLMPEPPVRVEPGTSEAEEEPGDAAAPRPVEAPPGPRVVGAVRGPAARAGLKLGDVIVRIDDEPTPRLVDFRRMIARRSAGDEVRVTVWRDGATQTVTARLAAAADFAGEPESQPAASQPESGPASAPSSQPESGPR